MLVPVVKHRARAHPLRARRATASYFRAGHLLLDSLAQSLLLEQEIQALDQTGGKKVETEAVRPRPRSAGTRDQRPPNALPRQGKF